MRQRVVTGGERRATHHRCRRCRTGRTCHAREPIKYGELFLGGPRRKQSVRKREGSAQLAQFFLSLSLDCDLSPKWGPFGRLYSAPVFERAHLVIALATLRGAMRSERSQLYATGIKRGQPKKNSNIIP